MREGGEGGEGGREGGREVRERGMSPKVEW